MLALFAAVFASGTPLLATYTQIFMQAAGQFIILYFSLFRLGAIFGKLINDSGSALSIAHGIVNSLSTSGAILSVVLACPLWPMGVYHHLLERMIARDSAIR